MGPETEVFVFSISRRNVEEVPFLVQSLCFFRLDLNVVLSDCPF